MRKTTRLRASVLIPVTLAATSILAAPPPAPDFSHIEGTPAPARGKIYVDCLTQAAAAGTYDRTSYKSIHLLRFHCGGSAAKVFYDELAGWSAARHSEWTSDGRTWRSTGKIVRNLFGTDYCSTDGAADYACEVTLNVGPFLEG